MEELVYDIVKGFDDENKDIDFVLTADEVPDFLTAFLSTGKFKPVCIDWAEPDINGYDREYYFSLLRFDDDNEVFVTPVYCEDRFVNTGNKSIILVSESVKMSTYNKFTKEYSNVLLFDIKD